MDKYRDFVENAAKAVFNGSDENQVFFNSGPIHAAIVMSRIFKYSEKEIKIFCGGFNGIISNDEDYLRYLDVFLNKGGSLKIFVERDNSMNPSSKIFKVLRKYPDNYELYQTDVLVTENEHEKPIHFMIGDERFLRVETDTVDYTAKVNFGNLEEAAKFSKIFDEIYKYNPTKLIA